jgi:hypothetical protein
MAAPSTATATPAAMSQTLPIEAFGTTPIIDNVTLSTDGRYIASSYAGDQVSIVVLDRDQKKVTQRIGFEQGLKMRRMFFVNESVMIATFSITYTQRGDLEQKSELGATFAINALDGSSRQLLEARPNSGLAPGGGGFLSRYGAAPGEILMSARLAEGGAAGGSPDAYTSAVVSINPLTGKWRTIEKGNPVTGGFLIDAKGKIVWQYDIPLFGKERKGGHGPEAWGNQAYSAIRLANGNTLIGGGNNHSVLEVDRAGKIVWQVNQNDLPGITLAWITCVDRLPNGNTHIGNCQHRGD